MQKKGLEFTLVNGKKDWYDPVEYPDGLKENETQYLVDNGAYIYEIEKSEVKFFSWYEICTDCGRELESDGSCSWCEASK